MPDFRLTKEAQRQIERGWELNERAWELLKLVVAEWNSDPSSVACFDLRLVKEAKDICKEHDQLPKPFGV